MTTGSRKALKDRKGSLRGNKPGTDARRSRASYGNSFASFGSTPLIPDEEDAFASGAASGSPSVSPTENCDDELATGFDYNVSDDVMEQEDTLDDDDDVDGDGLEEAFGFGAEDEEEEEEEKGEEVPDYSVPTKAKKAVAPTLKPRAGDLSDVRAASLVPCLFLLHVHVGGMCQAFSLILPVASNVHFGSRPFD
jgi:hypothetical protein